MDERRFQAELPERCGGRPFPDEMACCPMKTAFLLVSGLLVLAFISLNRRS